MEAKLNLRTRFQTHTCANLIGANTLLLGFRDSPCRTGFHLMTSSQAVYRELFCEGNTSNGVSITNSYADRKIMLWQNEYPCKIFSQAFSVSSGGFMINPVNAYYRVVNLPRQPQVVGHWRNENPIRKPSRIFSQFWTVIEGGALIKYASRLRRNLQIGLCWHEYTAYFKCEGQVRPRVMALDAFVIITRQTHCRNTPHHPGGRCVPWKGMKLKVKPALCLYKVRG